MPNGNTAGAERQYRAMDGAVPNRDTEGANRRDYSRETEASARLLEKKRCLEKACGFCCDNNVVWVLPSELAAKLTGWCAELRR